MFRKPRPFANCKLLILWKQPKPIRAFRNHVGLWIFGKNVIDPAMVAMVLVCLMVILGVIRWDDLIGYKPAWSVFIWFGTLVTLAEGLSKVGFSVWFAKYAASHLSGQSPVLVMISLLAVFFGVHYLFASIMAQTAAILPVIYLAGASVPGVPAATFALLLVLSLGMMGIITPYATGSSPIFFGSGYIPRKDFWVLGFVFGVIFLASLLMIGIPYHMMFLGALNR